MTTITTNVDKALLGSSASRLSTPAEGPSNIKVTDESLGDYAAHNEDSSDSEDEGYDSKDEWTKSFTFEYMAEHEPFTALPVNYLQLTKLLCPPRGKTGSRVMSHVAPACSAHRVGNISALDFPKTSEDFQYRRLGRGVVHRGAFRDRIGPNNNNGKRYAYLHEREEVSSVVRQELLFLFC
ncbi:hypothetical protein EDD18DRAFT_1113750 [Armillaria luteobubalina]|uniref:Uncharacterized protein n=1 Tax=Armillaria luteobubalina TaxID=153913 RepID=A0AA39TCE7_9AGAR|nr:hypothetical protein EDD18DRAFT_1113750 [Armillaria luteobubalina]